jgi:aminoglycoside 6'-N-acetyltransferase I
MPEWERLRHLLWPDLTQDENARNAEQVFNDDDRWAVLVCESKDELVGMVEAHLRDYAEGCDSSPVGFIEGWYVAPEVRRAGIGRALIEAAEEWARSRGCSEMASDTQLWNVESHKAHSALGYEEVERLVCFRKVL